MNSITIEAVVHSDIETVWEYWTNPEHVKVWNTATPDWECPHAENDLKVGGRFIYTMSAKDGSHSFDFSGTYTEVMPYEKIAYTLDDDRKVEVLFVKVDEGVHVSSSFEAEGENPEDMQRAGWQAILDNFKRYVEAGN